MRTKRWFLCGVIVTLITAAVMVAHAAETVKSQSLSESIDVALKQSVLINAAKEGVRGAEAQKREAFTGFLPKFSTSYSYTRYNRDPYLAFPGIPPVIPPANLTVGTKDNYNWIHEPHRRGYCPPRRSFDGAGPRPGGEGRLFQHPEGRADPGRGEAVSRTIASAP
jgi:hypothetical protein